MIDIEFNDDRAKGFVSNQDIETLQERVDRLHDGLENKMGLGNEHLGWLHLPSSTPSSLIDSIITTQKEIRDKCDAFVCIGIGGSYMGARAAISFLSPFFKQSSNPDIYFAGHTMCSDYYSDLFRTLEDKEVCVNVISKSGTTLEVAIAFRLLRSFMEKKYGKEESRKRIIVTTGPEKNPLNSLSKEKGYKLYVIPEDIGGRFSVLTTAGLLPIAISGVDLNNLMDGALLAESALTKTSDLGQNLAYRYAVNRHCLYQKGKMIELMTTFNCSFRFVLEWWKQLSGESEGKEGKGIFPASVQYPEGLHSLGQSVQEGAPNLFETFLLLEKSSKAIKIPSDSDDLDGLNYLQGKELDFVNEKAYKGSAAAHLEGGVPSLTLILKERSAYSLGQLFYFLERVVAMTGYLSNVNPFDQPGVDLYKKKIFILLNKPDQRKED
jgi:glucose-6-phosphate isomerase